MAYQVETAWKDNTKVYENFATKEAAEAHAKRMRARGAKTELILYKGAAKRREKDYLIGKAAKGDIDAQARLFELAQLELKRAKTLKAATNRADLTELVKAPLGQSEGSYDP